MTWFKSHMMRQNSPLLLIDWPSEEERSSLDVRKESRRASATSSKNNILWFNENTKVIKTCHRSLVVKSNKIIKKKVLEFNQQDICQVEYRLTESSELPNLVLENNNKNCRLLSAQPTITNCQESFEKKKKNLIKSHAPRRKITSRMQISHISTSLTNFLVTLIPLLLLVSCCFVLVASSTSSQQYFEAQPELQYLTQNGQDIRMRCLIRNRQGECMWIHNGKAIGPIAKKYQFQRQPENGDCSISIKNVSVQADDGLWQCQVTASELEQETLQSREVQLVVLVAPERPQIKNVSTNGHRLILEENKTKWVQCEMRGGNPAPQIEWLLDNKSIGKEIQFGSTPPNEPGLGANNLQKYTHFSRVKLSDIKRSMNGKNLTCVGVHPTQNQSVSVDLDVQYLPTVSVVQREYSIVEGSPLSISCQVDANPPPNQVNWRLVSDANDKGLQSPARPGPVLEFERISREQNQHVFECMAQNSYGISLPADIKLNVLYSPSLVNTSSSESVALGSQAQLACLFEGNPEPQVQWNYADPLSRSQIATPLEGQKQQYLTLKNVTYRNEGDYHCEARNQINGINYAIRSSNILLDVFGEPQFLTKSPVSTKAVEGSKSDLALTFCADPAPNKVYWQFGSLRLDVRLNNINNGQQILPSAAATPSSGSGTKQSAMSQRFQVHPLQTLQKRDTTFSKVPTCFEAVLTILDPELTDQRDYTLVVQNERGHQTGVVRVRVSSPLSPALMITSAFVTICGLFLLSLLIMFLLKKRATFVSSLNTISNGNSTNGSNGTNKSTNGLPVAVTSVVSGTNSPNGHQQQTRGLVNGTGNGLANQAANSLSMNLSSTGKQTNLNELKTHNMPSMGSDSSSSSGGDQKQLLVCSSDRNSSASGCSTTNQLDFNSVLARSSRNSSLNTSPTDHSTPTPLNHISVEDIDHHHHHSSLLNGSTYQAAESVTRDAQLSGHNLIYANLEYASESVTNRQRQQLNSPQQATLTASQLQQQVPLHRQRSQRDHSPSIASSSSHSLQAISPNGTIIRSSVGATIAMMNSLAAQQRQASNQSPNGAGALSDAINQQLSMGNRQVRKPGPPKPPKPSIQQRSRFYQQQHVAASSGNNNGLVMIGSQTNGGYNQDTNSPNTQLVDGDHLSSANELAVEYSRIAFPARAEL